MARAMGNYSLHDYRPWREPRMKPSPHRVFSWAIAATPIAPLNLAARLAMKYFFRIPPGITLLALDAWRIQESRR